MVLKDFSKFGPSLSYCETRFISVSVEESVLVDEQMCSTKARSYLKQYIANKPHKYGYELFVISGISGCAYDFEVLTGDENRVDKQNVSEELRACANVVVRLSSIVPHHITHCTATIITQQSLCVFSCIKITYSAWGQSEETELPLKKS
ncbi:hypothetical protein PR048_013377 [Dryococelus australis]|uniref:PiggyBac transposable element-derived protein domain-containing protein n=1 Tax=Dryococelus australis TaxID=614101 RepID=A0ABQ9HRZ6_9NEOP|nr:hypothetical protein PR048_013377 [Dryococelus australis]